MKINYRIMNAKLKIGELFITFTVVNGSLKKAFVEVFCIEIMFAKVLISQILELFPSRLASRNSAEKKIQNVVVFTSHVILKF